MISKDMYHLLKMIPKSPNEIEYTTLINSFLKPNDGVSNLHPCLAHDLLKEARENGCTYVSCSTVNIEDGYFSLTEKGLSAVEEYERTQRNDFLVKLTFIVGIISALAAIISCIT